MTAAAKIKQVLADENTFATTLLVVVADQLGLEFTAWDPETISLEVASEFGLELPERNYNKLMAAVELVTTENFYRNLPDFIRLCNVLDHGTFDPRVFDPADAGEISWGITEALLIWPPDPKLEDPFAEEITTYIGLAITEEGIITPPDVLRLGGGSQELWSQVQATFSDDPQMFSAIYEVEREKTEEINQLVRGRLHTLLRQLEKLPIANGTTEGAVERMLANLKATQRQGEQMTSIYEP